MKRRQFLKTSIAASTVAGLGAVPLSAAAAVPKPTGNREYYELRVYRLKPGAKRDLLDSYLEKALIPAMNRLGSKSVGVFYEKDKEVTALYVLMPFASIAEYQTAATRVAADPDYQKEGAQYLQVPKDNPAFDRIDSWLLLAFAGMPRLELPAYSKARQPRLFELRTYESYSEAKAAKKIEMFNSGEIDVMHEVGLAPIFYGQALIGPNLPHLTYMTSGPDEASHKQHWDAFGKHPTWVKLKNDPQYADTVSKTTKWILVPTAYSQI